MADCSVHKPSRGRPKGSGKKGKKRLSAENARQFIHSKSRRTDAETLESMRSGNDDNSDLQSEGEPSNNSVTSQLTMHDESVSTQSQPQVLSGNILMDIGHTPWLSPEDSVSENIADASVSKLEPDDAQEIFKSVYKTLARSDLQTVCVSLVTYFNETLGYGKTESARMVKDVTGIDDKTVRTWKKEFYNNNGTFNPSRAGKYERQHIFEDEDLKEKARQYVRDNACQKGQPNMRAADFCIWVNTELLPNATLPPHFPRTMSVETARVWLHHLGFKYLDIKKGTYFDGHEREDVVDYRKDYINKLKELEDAHLLPPKPSDEVDSNEEARERKRREDAGYKHLVLIYHDESAFSANDDQPRAWGNKETNPIRPKGRGSGIMVSDFVEEHDGYLRLSEDQLKHAQEQGHDKDNWEAREKIEYGENRDGYWTGEKFVNQVERALDIAAVKYPADTHTVVWLFDQSKNHTAMDEKALNAKRLNLNPGGAQPAMRDTVWQGKRQSLVFESGPLKGKPKGAFQILKERGYEASDLKKMKLKGCVEALETHEDFANEKSKVETLIVKKGHLCLFIPKYHCELNPIERCWGRAKVYTRSHCNYSILGLRRSWQSGLETVSIDDIRKYFRRVREYLRAYREGNTGIVAVENAVKKYKSHRRVHHTQ